MPPNSVQSSPDVGQRFLLMKIKHTDLKVPAQWTQTERVMR
jgi:hypothetical protein